MSKATIHDQLYILALVYTNDIERLKYLYESRVLDWDIDYVYNIPLFSDEYANKVDAINELLLINGFFTDLNDFMKKNRLFQLLFMLNKIDRLSPNPKIELMFNDSFEADLDENRSMPPNEPSHQLDMNESNEYFGMTLLKVAVLMEYEEMVKCLMDYGASIKPFDLVEIHPIHLALYQNNRVILKLLLDSVSPIDVENKSINQLIDHNGLNPLHIAIYNQSIECIDLLYKAGADFNIVSNWVSYPLIWAMEIADISDEVISHLISLNADPNVVDEVQGISPLILSIMSDRIELVKLLLASGADVNQTFEDPSLSALTIAIDYFTENNNAEEIVRSLLDAGASINFEIPNILSRVNEQNVTTVSEWQGVGLLNHEGNGSFGRYPLIYAIYVGCESLVRILIEYGAYIHTIGFDYYSPLCSACYVNNNEIANLLLRQGVDPTLSCFQSNTPLSISIARVSLKILETYRLSTMTCGIQSK